MIKNLILHINNGQYAIKIIDNQVQLKANLTVSANNNKQKCEQRRRFQRIPSDASNRMLTPSIWQSVLISSESTSSLSSNIPHAQHEVFSQDRPDYLVTSILVSSYAQVGWIPILESSCCFVRPACTATANPCITSPALGPAQCSPITLSVQFSTTALAQTMVLKLVPSSLYFSKIFYQRGVYLMWQIDIFYLPYFRCAYSQLAPQQLYSRGVKMVVGQFYRLMCLRWVGNSAFPTFCAIRRPKCQPILVAVLVSQGSPQTTSPRAQMLSALVLSIQSARVSIFLLLCVVTPAFFKFSVSVVAVLPTANSTVSNSSASLICFVAWSCTTTSSFPVSFFLILIGSEVGTMLTLRCCISVRICFTMSLSKARRYYPLVIRDTLQPMPRRNPAIYTATYPPPTTKVLPGGVFLLKISSLVIAC